jgi:hypothetical protein
LTTLALLAVGILADVLSRFAEAYYAQLELRRIPWETELALRYQDLLPRWLLPLAIAGSGIPFACPRRLG